MRHAIDYILTVLVYAFISVLFVLTAISCKPENTIESAGQTRSTGCRLVSRTMTHTSSTSPYSQNSNWTYNANAAPAQYSNPSAVGQYPSRVDFNYDTAGYLTKTTQVRVYSGITGFFSDTLITEYEYTKGKLVRQVVKDRLFNQSGIISYEYNQSGELTKIVDRSDGDTKIYVFAAGKLIDYVTLYYGSTAEVHPYELNDGRIVREYARDRQYYSNYQYDEQGRPTKIEWVGGSRVTQYYTYSYTDGKAYFEAIPLPKGWPTVSRKTFVYEELSPRSPVTPIGLPMSWARYATSRPGSTDLFKNIVKEYTHVKNNQGYPVRSEYTTSVHAWSGETISTPSRITETYLYEGCP